MNIIHYVLLLLILFFNDGCKGKKHHVVVNSQVETTETAIHPNLKLIANLSDVMSETSGLIFYNKRLFTHNDKGNPNQVFVIDTLTGKIKNLIVLTNAQSVDYEDIAESNDYIFIGDFGNNHGNRTDLCIYRFKKSDLNFKSDTVNVTTQKINFSYPEQTSFKKSKSHNFDCEAMIFNNDSLFLFTKNRLDDRCNLYAVPNKTGNHKAKLISNFDSKGLISGADISKDGSKVVLTGYSKTGNSFLWVLSGFKHNDFFSGSTQQIILGPYNLVGQIEAVCFSNPHKLFISAEKKSSDAAKLYSMTL